MTNAEKIAEYKKLYDEGAITAEEYEQKKEELLKNSETTNGDDKGTIPAKVANIIAYITWIGFLLALLLGDKEKCKFHVNQALVLNLFALLSIIPILGWIWAIIILVLNIIGLVSAACGTEKKVPILGGIKLIQ